MFLVILSYFVLKYYKMQETSSIKIFSESRSGLWAVHPSFKHVAAMPDDAIVTAIILLY